MNDLRGQLEEAVAACPCTGNKCTHRAFCRDEDPHPCFHIGTDLFPPQVIFNIAVGLKTIDEVIFELF